MDYLKNNLELIKQNSISLYNIINEAPDEDFELEVEVSKKGPLTMKTKGEKNIYLHSRYNPENEARKIIEKGIENDTDVVVIGGFALGYLPEAVLKLDKIPDIIVIEKSAKIIKEAFSARDFRPLLTSGKFDFLITGRIEDATTLLDNKATRKISMIIHRPSYDLFPDFYQNLRNVIYSFINSKEVNIAT
ncbi:MAG: motility associated factor glycosyltransferase family protein, partial [Spirochaetes bacterium]|nr:motility associated factor glycosyltransferase family protein [Spirochaetota bacterium]